MTTTTTAQPFEATPLITPERIYADPQEAFSVLPSWVHHAEFIAAEQHPEAHPAVQPVVMVWLGESHVLRVGYSSLNLAALCEVSRLPGITILVNSNGKGRHYVRISISGHREDLTVASRFLAGAAEYVQIKEGENLKSDMRPQNLRADVGEKVGRDARHVVLSHAKRIAMEMEASGRMPPHITAADYLENLQRLLQLGDLEATGTELSSALPMIPTDAGRKAAP